MVKLAALDICSEKNTRESVVGTFKNICTVAVHYWYIKDAFEGILSTNISSKKFGRHFRGNQQKSFCHA